MKKVIVFCAVLAVLFTSCVKNSSEYKALQAKNDSLVLANARADAEIDQFMALLNEVEENFQSIKIAENYLSMQSSSSCEIAFGFNLQSIESFG